VRWPEDALGDGREFSQRTFVNQFLPLLVGVAFMFLLFMSSGYLLGTVAEEKGNRTIEMLVTSVSTSQLMGGKVAGVVAVSLTQFVAWITFAVLVVLVGRDFLGMRFLDDLSLDVRVFAPIMSLFVPAYILYAALMATVGATVAEPQDGQGVMGVFILLSMVPVWLLQPIIEHPNGPLAIGFSLFPTTALPTMSFRVAFSQVPLWQMVTSFGILLLSACAAVWMAGRAFRLGMLRYGQNLNWRELLGRA
jgi:ABC-2 type transport system permease protein